MSLGDSEWSSFESNSVFDRIPEYNKIILDLSKGNLNGNFSLNKRKSKLSHSIRDILFDQKNDELSYFALFMDSNNASNYLKFLLDVNNFKLTAKNLINLNECIECIEQKENFESNQDHYKNFVQDAISIFEKYISKDAKYSIQLNSELITEIIRRICPERNEKINSNCFDELVDDVFKIIEQFYDKYLISEYHFKYLTNILEKRDLSLSDFLYDDFAVVFFLEFLEQENVSCLLKFWIQADNFTRNLQNVKLSELLQNSKNNFESLYNQWQNDAMIIYDNFISLQAKEALGFDDLVRRQVELNICQLVENEKESIDYLINNYSNCFYIPLLIVFSILEKSFFSKFLNSIMYEKYVYEVLCNSKFELLSIKNEPNVESKITKENNLIKQNEPLWSNPLSSTMQIGQIDNNGRFIRFLESDHKIEKRSSGSTNDKVNLDDEDDIWNLDEENANSKKNSSSDLFDLRNKFDKILNMIPINVRSSSKFSNDDYELAEQIAANLVNEVIQLNQTY